VIEFFTVLVSTMVTPLMATIAAASGGNMNVAKCEEPPVCGYERLFSVPESILSGERIMTKARRKVNQATSSEPRRSDKHGGTSQKVNQATSSEPRRSDKHGGTSQSTTTKAKRAKRPTTFETAKSYVDARLSVIPIRADGSKAPWSECLPTGEDGEPTWKPYQKQRPYREDLATWFDNEVPIGIAILGGKVSGNLEVLDIDSVDLISEWKKSVKAESPGLLDRLPQVKTPNGLHVYNRCSKIDGNQKLAMRSKDDPAFESKPTLIETKSEGGYVLAPGCHLDCHETGRPYKHVGGPPLTKIARITTGERDVLLTSARMLNRNIKEVTGDGGQTASKDGTRPGDDFNCRASWKDIIEPRGWQQCGGSGKEIYWRRPGKKIGWSATTGHCSNRTSGDLLYVFSSNAEPFEPSRAYSKFAAYALLKHKGNFKAAARDLAEQGYGEGEKLPASGSYHAIEDGMVWQKATRDGNVDVPLTNFTARIVTDVIHDDGAEQVRHMEIEAVVGSRTCNLTIPADEFSSMKWVAEHLGPKAILLAGMSIRDHARCAIQTLSEDVSRRTVYAHTGWRRVGDGWVYLHAGGGIGRVGRVSNMEIALPDALSGFQLPDIPGRKRDLVKAVRASLRTLELASDSIMFPIYCSAWRVVLGPLCDFSIHLAGPTGAGKTELASIIQQHWGKGLDSRHLPASWSGTANALEALAFAAKDALMVVDDFAPQGTQSDVARLDREADRLLRAQGNRAGRQRMRQDTSLRPAKYPRGLILSTGEAVPSKQSIRARMLVIEVGPEYLDWDRLTESQENGAAGLYAQAMAGFVRWLASHYDDIKTQFHDDVADLRQTIATKAMHPRTPIMVAELLLGFRWFLDYAMEIRAFNDGQKSKLWDQACEALRDVALAQVRQQAESEPVQRFLAYLASAIVSCRAHVAGADGEQPEPPELWGWKKTDFVWIPRGQLVGWVDGIDLYLEPQTSYSVAQLVGRDSSKPVGEELSTLKRRLNEKGVLVSTDKNRQTLTIRKTLANQRREVLHLHASSLFPSEPKPDQPDQQSRGSK
jgi:hypothetical protein